MSSAKRKQNKQDMVSVSEDCFNVMCGLAMPCMKWNNVYTFGTSDYVFIYFGAYHKYVHTLQWRHNGRDGVSNHQHHDCLLNRLFGHRSE